VSETLSLPDERRVGIGRPAARFPFLALVIGLALLTAACGRAMAGGPGPGTGTTSYQTLVVGARDPEGNALTVRFESLAARSQATAVPTNAADERFTPAGGISYLLPDSIRTLQVAGGGRTDASTATGVIAAFAWSRDGTLAYVAHGTAVGGGSRLVIRGVVGTARTIALPPAVGGAAPNLRFSPDGRLLLLVDAALAGQSSLQVRRLDGGVVFQAGGASEGTWAGSGRVYYMDARGVNVADLATGRARTILPDVQWRAPDSSPDGGTVVFELRGAGQARLELLSTSTDAVLPGFARDGGTDPRFVSPTEVWFHDAGGPAIVSLDIERRTETPTGLSGIVTDVRQVAAT
jgi:hypothetical protein